jgi:transposase-like protein
MSNKVTIEDKRRIVMMRALDYSKQDIADEVGVSRNTVDYHLEQIRDDIESNEHQEMALVEFLFEPDDLVQFVFNEADTPLKQVQLDDISIPLGKLVGNDD